jgi:hypothetical protein
VQCGRERRRISGGEGDENTCNSGMEILLAEGRKLVGTAGSGQSSASGGAPAKRSASSCCCCFSSHKRWLSSEAVRRNGGWDELPALAPRSSVSGM